MPKKQYWANILTGGAPGSLDIIPGTDLADLDMAYVVTADLFYTYSLDADSAASESSPDVISPDTDAGDKRWILTGIGAGITTFTNTGLHIFDTDASHDLILKPGSDITADRTLTLTTGNADRTLTLNENLTIGDGTNITITGVTAARTITLNENLTIGDGTDITITGVTQANTLTLHESLTIGDGNSGTITFGGSGDTLTINETLTLAGGSGKTITVEDNAVVSQDYSADSTSVSLAGLALSGNLVLAANSITGTSVALTNAKLQQLSTIGAVTVNVTQWGYLGLSTAAGGAVLDAANDAAILALLSGDAGAAFSWNGQNLTSVGTIGCDTITIASTKTLAFADGGSADIIRDEDNMASDDVNALCTQESIKAYTDAAGGTGFATVAALGTL